jgi:hypothetical protein
MPLPPEAMCGSKEKLYTAIKAWAARYYYASRIGWSTKINSGPKQRLHTTATVAGHRRQRNTHRIVYMPVKTDKYPEDRLPHGTHYGSYNSIQSQSLYHYSHVQAALYDRWVYLVHKYTTC